jgi:hypothetical protein
VGNSRTVTRTVRREEERVRDRGADLFHTERWGVGWDGGGAREREREEKEEEVGTCMLS